MPCPFVPAGHFPTLWGITLSAELSQLDRSCLRLWFYSQHHTAYPITKISPLSRLIH
jgi:hypothetical protein